MAQVSRLALLEDSVKDLKDRLAAIEDTAILGTFTLHVETFAPEPYNVKRPVPISLQRPAGWLHRLVCGGERQLVR
jgi:hypothetical protein